MRNKLQLGAGALLGALAVAAIIRGPQLPFAREGFHRIFPAILLWVAFFFYWGIESRNAGATVKSESDASTLLHQLALAAALLLLFVPFTPSLAARYLPHTWTIALIGLTIQASFFALAVWARRHLGRNWAAEVRIAVDHELVRTGPYRYIRHPIYTAMLGMFVGTAITTGEVHSLIAIAILALAYARKTRLEEQILQKTFGADFEAYRRDTWALVPGLF